MSFMPPRQYTCTSIRISSGICWDHFWSIKKAVCIPICMQLYTLVRFSPNMVKSMDWMASWRYSLLQGYGNKQCAQRRCWAWVVRMHSTVFELIGVLCRIRKHADYDVCACPEDGRHFSTRPTCAAFSFLSFPSAYVQTCYSTIYSEDGRITLSSTFLRQEASTCIHHRFTSSPVVQESVLNTFVWGLFIFWLNHGRQSDESCSEGYYRYCSNGKDNLGSWSEPLCKSLSSRYYYSLCHELKSWSFLCRMSHLDMQRSGRDWPSRRTKVMSRHNMDWMARSHYSTIFTRTSFSGMTFYRIP